MPKYSNANKFFSPKWILEDYSTKNSASNDTKIIFFPGLTLQQPAYIGGLFHRVGCESVCKNLFPALCDVHWPGIIKFGHAKGSLLVHQIGL